MDSGGEWIMGCEVPLEKPWRGRTKLIRMAASAITEVLQGNTDIVPEQTPLLLCLAEQSRPGRVFEDDNRYSRPTAGASLSSTKNPGHCG